MEHKVTLYEGKFKRLVVKGGWEYIERVNCDGVVVVLAMTEEKKVLFVEQHRIPVGKEVIEFPAGLANDLEHVSDETLAEAANRELLEETGYQAQEMEWVLTGPAGAASSADLLTLFRAKKIKKVAEGGGDHTESITVHEVSLDSADEWLLEQEQNGKLIDPKVYAGLYFLKK